VLFPEEELGTILAMKPNQILAARCSRFDEDATTYTTMLQLGPYPGWHFALAMLTHNLESALFSKPDVIWQVLVSFHDRDGMAVSLTALPSLLTSLVHLAYSGFRANTLASGNSRPNSSKNFLPKMHQPRTKKPQLNPPFV
jgi:hypothetical protein